MEKENRIDDIKAEFELREKRLKLVYKIVCRRSTVGSTVCFLYNDREKCFAVILRISLCAYGGNLEYPLLYFRRIALYENICAGGR